MHFMRMKIIKKHDHINKRYKLARERKKGGWDGGGKEGEGEIGEGRGRNGMGGIGEGRGRRGRVG